ncbi:MAG: DCC1-like thiol-disulfide oxidoreductase family protein [Fimbriimonadaceae bacterium]
MNLVLYDGICGLCNRSAQFILRHDLRDKFRFATLQGERGSELAKKHGIDPTKLSTFVLILDLDEPNERALTAGKAAFRVLWELGGPWRLVGWKWIFPSWLLDPFYGVVARNRYRVFGRLDACPIPKPAERAKFLD